MASLTDHIDRLGANARKLKSTADAINSRPSSSFYTDAVLHTHLGDLIREVDDSEIGLFTLKHPATNNPAAPAGPQITRTEFTTATPLRKQPARHENAKKTQQDLDPEDYARVALKYMEQYEGMRPMPRRVAQAQQILHQVGEIRTRISDLQDELQVAQSMRENVSLIEEEQQRVDSLQAQIAQLKKRKEAAQKKKETSQPGRITRSRFGASGLQPSPRKKAPMTEEDSFWEIPTSSSNLMGQLSTGLLKEDLIDLADISTSFASPYPTEKTRKPQMLQRPRVLGGGSHQVRQPAPPVLRPRSPSTPEAPQPTVPSRASLLEHGPSTPTSDPTEQHEEEDDNDRTILPESPAPAPSTPPPDLSKIAVVNTPGRTNKVRVKVTHEVERIVAKMWATLGQVIIPGNKFDASGLGGERPPTAKATIAHLEKVSSSTPAIDSPSASSISSTATPSGPTLQEIMTCFLLLCLLSSAPSCSMSLNKLKEVVDAKGKALGGGAQPATRIIYSCVAKRLLKIDRGGGEQVVKFDA